MSSVTVLWLFGYTFDAKIVLAIGFGFGPVGLQSFKMMAMEETNRSSTLWSYILVRFRVLVGIGGWLSLIINVAKVTLRRPPGVKLILQQLYDIGVLLPSRCRHHWVFDRTCFSRPVDLPALR